MRLSRDVGRDNLPGLGSWPVPTSPAPTRYNVSLVRHGRTLSPCVSSVKDPASTSLSPASWQRLFVWHRVGMLFVLCPTERTSQSSLERGRRWEPMSMEGQRAGQRTVRASMECVIHIRMCIGPREGKVRLVGIGRTK